MRRQRVRCDWGIPSLSSFDYSVVSDWSPCHHFRSSAVCRLIAITTPSSPYYPIQATHSRSRFSPSETANDTLCSQCLLPWQEKLQ